MQKLKIKSTYPITFTREIEKELDLDTFQFELEDYLEDLYGNEVSKKILEQAIKSLYYDILGMYNEEVYSLDDDYDILGMYNEEVYSLDDDLNMVDDWKTEVKVLNISELIKYFSYLINKED